MTTSELRHNVVQAEVDEIDSAILEDYREPSASAVTRYRWLISLFTIALIVAAWQGCAELKLVNPSFTSSPSAVVRAARTFYGSGGPGWHDLAISGEEYGLGMSIAVLFGIPIGLAIGYYELVSAVLEPLVYLLYAMPLIALAPLFIVWFGIGLESKVVMVFVISVVPILINAAAGARAADQSLITVAKSFKATDIQIFRHIILPGAVPPIVAGVRLAAGIGIIGVVVAELVASTGGIGYAINSAGSNFEVNQLFVGLVTIALIGLAIASGLRAVERAFDRWRL